MHEACVYLSYYGAVTFFLQMEPVRQEQGAHVKQNTHAMQREKQHACKAMQHAMQSNAMQSNAMQRQKQHAIQCNAMQQEKQHGSNAMIKASTHAME